MRGLAVLFVYLTLMVCGFQVASVMALAYIWSDLFRPQYVAYTIISGLPVSMICGVLAIIAWFVSPGKPKRVTVGTAMLIMWVIWITLTTFGAVVQDFAWAKWDWAFKGALFAVLLPYFFNTREQIEAAILVVLVSVGANCIPIGTKTILSGGGYGVDLGLVGGTAGLTEGSTFAMVAASIIPLLLWAARHSVLINPAWIRKTVIWGLVALALVAALGTFARTGLVAVVVLLVAGLVTSRRKILYLVVVFSLASAASGFMGEAWSSRMSTLKSAGGDSSAMGRVGVWLWTLDYVKEHPAGGGFDIYKINSIAIELDDGTVIQDKAKAFHSIYFEVLGEQGIPGLLLFLGMLCWSLLSLNWLRRTARKRADLEWAADAAAALMVATLVYMAGGAFVGVAYQPYFWYLFSIGIALRHLVERESRGVQAAGGSYRAEQGSMPSDAGIT